MIVEHFEENDDAQLVCQCYDPDTDEPCFERTLSLADLSDYVCDQGNKVRVTSLYVNRDDYQAISFYEWYNEAKHTPEMLETIAALLNIHEKRMARCCAIPVVPHHLKKVA